MNDEENEGYIRKRKEIEKDKRSSKSYIHQQCFLLIPHTGSSDYRISLNINLAVYFLPENVVPALKRG